MATIPYPTHPNAPRPALRRRTPQAPAPPVPSEPRHRLREVRLEEGMTIRAVAERMNITVGQALAEEKATSDLHLNVLRRWQSALKVPIEHLLVESDETLSRPVLDRARLVRLMKTTRALQEQADSEGLRHLADTLAQQLTEIMPELASVGPWLTCGQPRTLDELGRIAENCVSSDLLKRA